MYLSTARTADAASGVERGHVGGRVRGVPATVFALGTVSLLTDVSSEMVTAVLPIYIVVQLGLTPLAFGLLDGVYGGVSALVRLLGGHAADRGRRHKLVAGLGYGLSAAAKPALLVVSTVPTIAAVLAVDRSGKGLRTAPRDALISLSTGARDQGRAFGVHRAMDTAGALLGPAVAFGLLWYAADAYDAVFVVSGCVAAAGVLVLVLFVQRPPGEATGEATGEAASDGPGEAKEKTQLRAALGLLRLAAVRRICVAAALLGLVTISDAFVFLLIQKRLDLDPQWFPLLPLGTAAGFLALAMPLGLVADRIGRWPVFVGGHAALLGAYALLLLPYGGITPIIGVLFLHGTFYAATDGVLMAAAGPHLPAELRASGMALVQTGQATTRFVSSLAFGAAWTAWGIGPSVGTAAVALALTAVAAAFLRPGSPTTPDRPQESPA
ncbi:MFS transporter [Actinomadura barringtoniae]|uniref:MFS transporter n=1 Tax=Actinomadura barringtoniae TaxID=1427535 RepID=A0A939PG82_9ACTN|nr:MFS transporter [Actinomadura barringtoniae]MBO2451682.1 MFS transporter [Actinomadura barringtoniae]